MKLEPRKTTDRGGRIHQEEWNPAELDSHSERRRAGGVHCNHRPQKKCGGKTGGNYRSAL